MVQIENTLENKAKFFALYVERVMVELAWEQGWNPEPVQPLRYYDLGNERVLNGSLLLKAKENVPDNVALKVARFLNYGFNNELAIDYGRDYIKNLSYSGKTWYLPVYTYLISLGYYCGDGTEIEFGWVKLID